MTYLKPPKAQHRRGFTLLEVVSVLVLLGILAGFAVSKLPSSNLNLVTEADRLTSHLRYAQVRSQADIYEWRVVFTDSKSYQLGPIVDPGPGFTPRDIPGLGGTLGTLNHGVTAAAGTSVSFDSWGRPVNESGALFTASKTITLSDGIKSKSIIIRAETGLIE